MNFDNMVELNTKITNYDGEEIYEPKYPLVPGVWLLWAILIATYAALLVYAIHNRVLYAAT